MNNTATKREKFKDWVLDAVIGSVIFSCMLYFDHYSNLVPPYRIYNSLLRGFAIGILVTVIKILINPWVESWKASIKKRRLEKNSSPD
jgi:hypothetical protein